MSILALMAYELDEPLAALMSSSAKHSAIDFTLRNADSRVYIGVRHRWIRKWKEETYANGEEGDRLVYSAEGGDIDGLATDGTLRADTGGVFTGTSVDNGVNENLYSRSIG